MSPDLDRQERYMMYARRTASTRLYFRMILGYRDKQTAAFAKGEHVRAFSGFAKQAYKRLEILDAATSLNDLKVLRSNRLGARGR